MVECLPNKHKALSSNSKTDKGKKDINKNKDDVAILISDKIEFEAKIILRGNEYVLITIKF
jgi:hypothetical protein